MQLKVTFEANNGDPDRYVASAEATRVYVFQVPGKAGDHDMDLRLVEALGVVAPYGDVIGGLSEELALEANLETPLTTCGIPQAPAGVPEEPECTTPLY